MGFTKIASTFLVILFLVGCSGESTPEPHPHEQVAAEIDRVSSEMLMAPNNMEARSWLKRVPKSSIGLDANDEPILLAPLVTKFENAGATRVVVEFSELSRDAFIISLVVILPTDAAKRKRVFELEPETSRVYGQEPITDVGQKYLQYSFD